MIRKYILCACALFLVGHALHAQQSGDLDSTFSADGIALNDLVAENDYAQDIALQPDGKIVAVGIARTMQDNLLVVRYLPDGELDASFGSGGFVITAIGSFGSGATKVAIQPDGKIVVGGFSSYGPAGRFMAVLRYHADGSLDSSFAGDGIREDDMTAGDDSAAGLAVQSDGKIVVTAGGAAASNFVTMRLTAAGELDPGFADNGVQTTSVATNSVPRALLLQPDGRIIVVGEVAEPGFDVYVGIARYNSDGSADASFGVAGEVIHAFAPGHNRYFAATLQPDGKIIVAGVAGNGQTAAMGLARFHTNGDVDATFGDNGNVILPTQPLSEARSVAVLPDGRIFVGGNRPYIMEVALLNPDGSVDTGFSQDGLQTTPIDTSSTVQAVAVQADGKALAAGMTYIYPTGYAFTVVRYLTDGLSGIAEESSLATDLGVYPNPSAGSFNVHYTLQRTERITLRLFDAEGREMMTVLDRTLQQAGTHDMHVDLSIGIAAGSYVLQFSVGRKSATVPIMKL
ncbi:MAG TPA: T9SS type A sorting domain-containing protein [Flavobacteriales bacterium]|nr:T9SS type A sorting domain-containing protein [Flavobacteriales bacterium]